MPINMPKNKKTSAPFVYKGYRSLCKIYFKIKVGNFSSGGEKTPKKHLILLTFLVKSYDLFEEFLLLLFYCC